MTLQILCDRKLWRHPRGSSAATSGQDPAEAAISVRLRSLRRPPVSCLLEEPGQRRPPATTAAKRPSIAHRPVLQDPGWPTPGPARASEQARQRNRGVGRVGGRTCSCSPGPAHPAGSPRRRSQSNRSVRSRGIFAVTFAENCHTPSFDTEEKPERISFRSLCYCEPACSRVGQQQGLQA